jgi:3-deoxy-D-manno-octulosonic-acid transferase
LIAGLLRQRLAAGREDPQRFGERLGYASRPRPSGPLIWCHAASVGEAMSVLSLIEEIQTRHPAFTILLTTGTVTSARLLAGRLPPQAIHQFMPVDRWPYVIRFLDHWKPDLALWIESELWPNMLENLGSRKIPAILLNGRMSEKSFRRWTFLRGFAKKLLSNFALCLVQTEEEQARYEALKAPNVKAVGNLKFAAAPLSCDEAELQRLRGLIGNRKCWVMASTHPGEDEIALTAHRHLRQRWPDLLTIIVPRHPTRGPAIAEMLAKESKIAVRSKNDPLLPETEIYLADTMGELGLFYRLAPVTGLAGSFTWGGHNPIEPAQLGSAIVFGPRMTNFKIMAEEMLRAEAALQVANENEFTTALEKLLGDEAELHKLATSASRFALQKQGVMEDIQKLLAPFLNKLEGDKI